MSTPSTQEREENLRAYSVLVDTWSATESDSHLLIGYRELLHAAIDDMTDDQRSRLMAADELALQLAANNNDARGWDAEMLRETAALIKTERALTRA